MTLIDVRSPQEFLQGHIPGALNLPLFSDTERALVGTCYKREGQEKALSLGLSLVGPKLHLFVDQALQYPPPLKVYCARGGMRSEAIGWLLNFAKIPVTRLDGGYKQWRQRAHLLFQKRWNLHILGGMTGVSKTKLLHKLQERGFSTIDLEALASHRGSSFGLDIGKKQPTQEQFENLLAQELLSLDVDTPLFLEDESRFIGICKIPDPFFHQMGKAPLFLVEKPKETRIQTLVSEYGTLPKETLIEAFDRLHKRVGRERIEEAKRHLIDGNFSAACSLALDYYDRCYQSSLRKREGPISPFSEEIL